MALHRILCGDLQPDLTILMDSDVGTSVERARRRNQSKSADATDESRFESENRSFFTRVHSAYLEIAKREPERVVVVDARGSAEQTHAKIMELVFSRIDVGKVPRRTQNAG
jgi:dTMP kinase